MIETLSLLKTSPLATTQISTPKHTQDAYHVANTCRHA